MNTMQTTQGFGVNVWWTVPELSFDAAQAQTILTKNGFEATDLVSPSKRAEVSRAVYSLQNRRGKSNRRITEKATEDGSVVVYGILDQDKVDANTVEFKQQTTVTLDKNTDTVTVSGELVAEVNEAIAEFTGKITDADVRAFLRRIVKQCNGIPKRPTGGIYFVPETTAQIVESAQFVLDEMMSGAVLYVEGVVNGARERKNVWAAVENTIDAEIENAMTAVSRISKSVKAAQGQFTQLESAKELMAIYTTLLGKEAEQDEIKERLTQAVQTVSDKIADLQMGTAAKVAKVVGPKAGFSPKGRNYASNVVNEAATVLKENGTAMKIQEIIDAMVAKGVYSVQKSSLVTVNIQLCKAIADSDTRFVKVGRGKFQAA